MSKVSLLSCVICCLDVHIFVAIFLCGYAYLLNKMLVKRCRLLLIKLLTLYGHIKTLEQYGDWYTDC